MSTMQRTSDIDEKDSTLEEGIWSRNSYGVWSKENLRPIEPVRSKDSKDVWSKENLRSIEPIRSKEIAPNQSVPGTLDEKDVPPEGGYGWVCVVCVTMINACCWGINSAYGVYLSYYLKHVPPLYPEATALQYAFIGGITVASAMLISPLGTYITGRYHTKVTLILGCFVQLLSLICASFSTKIWQLFLTQGVLFGMGMGLLFVGSVGILPQWFLKRRSVVNGIAAGGSGIGGIAFSLGTNKMLKNLGLGWTFRITAIIAFTVNITSSLLLKDRNKTILPNQSPFDFNILKRKEFLLIIAWGFFSLLGYILILYSLPDFGVSLGFSSTQGSVMAAMLNLGMLFGRPLIGLYSDHAGRLNIAGLFTFLSALSVFIIWIPAKTFGVLIFFAIVNGAMCGVFWTTIAPVCAEIVGLVDLPSALNLTFLSAAIPCTFAEVIGLALRKKHPLSGRSNNVYIYAQIFAGIMYLVASVCMYFLRVWKIDQEDRKLADKVGQGARIGRGTKYFRWVRV